MPSQPFDTGWDFGPVLDLIDSDLSIASPTDSPASQPIAPIRQDKHIKEQASKQSLHLGDFAKLFEQLGISNGEPQPPVSPVEPDSEDPSSSDDVLPPSSDGAKDTTAGRDNVVGYSLAPAELSELFDEPHTGMTRKQVRKKRKKQKKEAAREYKTQKLLKSQQQVEKIISQRQVFREAVRKDREVLADSVVTESPTPRVEPAYYWTRAQSRSNVGAKIRPTTPVQLDPPFAAQKQSAPPPAQPETLPRPVPSQPLSSLAQPFTPAGVEHVRPSMPHPPGLHPSPALVDLGSALATQYTTFGTPIQPSSSWYSGQYFTPQVPPHVVYGHSLIPRTVQPIISQRPPHPVTIPQQPQFPVTPGFSRKPFTVRPQVDRHFHFLNQLMSNFPDDRKWLVSPKQLCNVKTFAGGIHVFVDISNIMIGYTSLIARRRIQRFDMSFDSLALLMERRRPVAKRVFAGSHREANPHPHLKKLAETSKEVGYENNVKEQVFICREDTERKKFFKDVERIGWDAAIQKRSGSGSGSDSETGQPTPSAPSTPKWVEQGVDEILHLKMCQSIIDTEVPTTMVLATGDGAEAEHSDGFLAHVERALKKGWKVELVSWKKQTSGGYTNKRFKAKWGDKFRIIQLDEYLESLIDTP